MRIAIVGAGISGLTAAWLLSRNHDVELFEANAWIGGHTHTHQVEQAGVTYAVDTGFIVCNRHNYVGFFKLLADLGVETQPTEMSFALKDELSGLEYNATDIDRLFVQRRNLFSPQFLRMIYEILRFYRESPSLLQSADSGPTIGEYLRVNGYSKTFIDRHLVPMGSALWSAPPGQMLEFPARYLVQFMANHRMLGIRGRPQWEVVKGGSASYVSAMLAKARFRSHINTPVQSVSRSSEGVDVRLPDGSTQRFDHVVFACHSDQALKILADPSERERAVLGAMHYQTNEVVLHTDRRMLPENPRAWAAWNALLPLDRPEQCTVTYNMNILQGLVSPEPFCVTLNRGDLIDPSKIIKRLRYAHPIYTREAVAAQTRWSEISDQQRTHYCGAYWGWGFHEDGVQSALKVCQSLGVSSW